MIPILYEKDETAFISNGLGRLRDCISAKVSEERNSIYELDFEYPVTGFHYEDIQLGRIVGVEHDDSNDVQPFDIVSYSRPINGVVTFHCQHISYRQSKITTSGTNINSLAAAFTMLGNSSPANPFTYWTDKASTGYMAAADGVPRSVRSFLGGVEGSILDSYGGEYEWDRFTVKLHSARGEDRDVTIRYGVNLTEYNEEVDYSGSYTAVIPFWTGDNGSGGTLVIKAPMVDSGAISHDGRVSCIPLDLTDKFENQPTTAQLTSMAQSIMASEQSYLPAQNIKVSFIRLQDTNEYSEYASLMTCKLCDTINVVFPRYNMSGRFKIVRTVYDVLLERFEEMELGTLSTSLAEALGISKDSSTLSTSRDVYSSSEQVTITATGTAYTAGTLSLPANKRFLVFSTVISDKGSALTLLNNIIVTSGTPAEQFGANTRCTTTSGQGVANWKLIRTGSSSVTVRVGLYGYADGGTGYHQTVYLMATEI